MSTTTSDTRPFTFDWEKVPPGAQAHQVHAEYQRQIGAWLRGVMLEMALEAGARTPPDHQLDAWVAKGLQTFELLLAEDIVQMARDRGEPLH